MPHCAEYDIMSASVTVHGAGVCLIFINQYQYTGDNYVAKNT